MVCHGIAGIYVFLGAEVAEIPALVSALRSNAHPHPGEWRQPLVQMTASNLPCGDSVWSWRQLSKQLAESTWGNYVDPHTETPEEILRYFPR